MTDAEMKVLAKSLKLPPIMWDTPGFRAALIVLADAAVAAERERCALVCEAAWEIDGSATANEYARLIRAAAMAGDVAARGAPL